MAITIDYSNPVQYVINVPKADMPLVSSSPTEIRQLDIDDFRKALADIQDDPEGMAFPTAYVHTAPLPVAGVTLARVVEILDPYRVEFEDDQYNVNVVGGNSNLSDVVIKNQVGVNTANSAGLQDPVVLEAAAYAPGEIALDVDAATTGISFPFGTRAYPVNNLADALTIAEERGLRRIRLLAPSTTFSAGDASDGFTFIGDSENFEVDIDAAADVTNSQFFNLTVSGTLDGNNTVRECVVGDLTFRNGFIFQCGLSGTVTLAGTEAAVFLQCFSLVAGGGPSQYPLIDLGGTLVSPLAVRDYQGGLGLRNLTSTTAPISIDMSSGRLVIENTVEAGTIYVRGIGDVVDNSNGATIVDQTMSTKVTDLHQFRGLDADNTLEIEDDEQRVAGKTLTVSDDGTTTTVDRQ